MYNSITITKNEETQTYQITAKNSNTDVEWIEVPFNHDAAKDYLDRWFTKFGLIGAATNEM
jgi:hypothetical protein